ncbi:MAG: hypothetical protein NVS2B16_24040 [Chloroflexota bacterium]
MKFGDLKNRPVVSVADARRLGYVETLLLDLDSQKILGLRVRQGGLLTHRGAVLLHDVKAVGDDAVTLEDASRLNSENKFSEFKNCSDLGPILGARVLTESGTVLGSVADVDVDLQAGTISGYVLGGNLLDRVRGQEHVIQPATVKTIGDKMIVVANDAAQD